MGMTHGQRVRFEHSHTHARCERVPLSPSLAEDRTETERGLHRIANAAMRHRLKWDAL